MSEDGLQLFQLQRRGDAEHASFSIEAAVRDEDVAVRIESEEIAEGLYGNDGAGDGIILRNNLPKKHLQGFPGTTAQIGKKLPVIKEISAEDLRDAEDEMPVGNLFENIHAQPLPEFHHTLLMAGGAEVTALAGKGQEIFMAAVLAFHTGKAVVQVTAIEITIDHLLDIGPPEAVLPGEMIIIDPDKGLEIVLHASVIIGRLRIP
jgi:hypothetical protein